MGTITVTVTEFEQQIGAIDITPIPLDVPTEEIIAGLRAHRT